MNTFRPPHENYRKDQDDTRVGQHQSHNTAYYVERWINNRGKGPRNYRRIDSRVEEDINESLLDDPYLDATEIMVSVNDGEVTLTGLAPDEWSRRRAEHDARGVGGVLRVHNLLQTPSSSRDTMGNESDSANTEQKQLKSFRENLKGHHSP